MPGILSERIASLRKERGLTQEQLGKMVGVSSQMAVMLLSLPILTTLLNTIKEFLA